MVWRGGFMIKSTSCFIRGLCLVFNIYIIIYNLIVFLVLDYIVIFFGFFDYCIVVVIYECR